MGCRDFERLWTERLDARGAISVAIDRDLEAHAAVCPSCRAIGARYQVLIQAIAALGPVPAVSPGFADRVLAAAGLPPRRPRVFRLAARRLAPFAAAAALFLAATLGLWALAPIKRVAVQVPPAVATVSPIDTRDLSEALADATSATLQLASDASAPAARLGRDVLDTADLPGSPLAESVFMRVDVGPSTEVLQGVSDRVNAGVRPLSGTARQAFSFLLGPSPEEPRKDAPPRPDTGA